MSKIGKLGIISPGREGQGRVVIVTSSLYWSQLKAKAHPMRQTYQCQTLLQAILETEVDGIVVIDTQGSIVAANKAVRTIFGYSPQELVGKHDFAA